MEAQKKIGVDITLEQDFIRHFTWAMWLAAKIAEAHGWHDPAPSDGECAALVHSEVSEIVETLRGKPLTDLDLKLPAFLAVEVEGADVVIRMMDWYRRRGWRLAEAVMAKMRFNDTRPMRHGGKAF